MFSPCRRSGSLLRLTLCGLAVAVSMSACSGSSPGPAASDSLDLESGPSESALATAADGDLEDFALLAGDAFFNGDYDLLKPYVDEQTARVFDTMVAGGLELRATGLRVAGVSAGQDGTSLVRYAGEFCASVPTSGSSSGTGRGDTNGDTTMDSQSTSSSDIETNCHTSTGDDGADEQTALSFARDDDGKWMMA